MNKTRVYTNSVYAKGLDKAFADYREGQIPVAADRYFSAVTVTHPVTKEIVVAEGDLLTEDALMRIHDAGIRSITVLDKAGVRRSFNADITGEIYMTIFNKLIPSCKTKSLANTMAVFSKAEDGEDVKYAKQANFRYYDPEHLCEHISTTIYMTAFPYFAANGVEPAAIDKAINGFIRQHAYKTAISSIYGSRHRLAENSLALSRSEDDEERSVLDTEAFREGAGADERLNNHANMCDLYDCAVHRFINPCVDGNNSLAKGLVALIAKVTVTMYGSAKQPAKIYELTAKILRKANSFGDLVALYKHAVCKAGCTLSAEACQILEKALCKTPTAKAFPGADAFAGSVAWTDISIRIVYDDDRLTTPALQVVVSDHLKAVRRFEEKNEDKAVKFIY